MSITHRHSIHGKHLVFLFVLLVTSLTKLYSQKEIVIFGMIKDSLNKPIVNASIIYNKQWVTSTNRDGKYSFKAISIPQMQIEIRCVGYHTKNIPVNVTLTDSIHIQTVLKVKAFALADVPVVFNTKPQMIFDLPDYTIKDFIITHDHYLVLAYLKSEDKAELFLADQSGNVLDKYSPTAENGKANFLRKETYGEYIHLFCNNELLRVNIIANKIIVLPTDIYIYYGNIRPVSDTINGHLIVNDFNAFYSNHSFYFVNKPAKSNKVILRVRDLVDRSEFYKFNYFKPDSNEIIERASLEIPKYDKRIIVETVSAGHEGDGTVKIDNGYQKNLWLIEFEKSRFYLPAPIFKIRDTICVFNLQNNILYHVNKIGSIIDSLWFTFQTAKAGENFEKIMLKDKTNNKVYGLYKKNGACYLKEISCHNGKVLNTIKPGIRYPEKISVEENYMYYIVKKPYDNYLPGLYKESVFKTDTNK